MYCEYFGFKQDPFNPKLDLEFMYRGPAVESFYEKLSSDILLDQGISVIIGKSGIGKTLMLYDIASRLKSRLEIVYLNYVFDSFEDFIAKLCGGLALETKNQHLLDNMQALNEFLAKNKKKRHGVVVMVDNSHYLKDETLKNILSISTPSTEHHAPIQIVLSGLPELKKNISRLIPKPSLLSTVDYHELVYLSSSEVKGFIKHRLKTAGYDRKELFTADAVSLIASHSNGIPLLINQLCREALVATQTENGNKVTKKIVDENKNYCVFEQSLDHKPEETKISIPEKVSKDLERQKAELKTIDSNTTSAKGKLKELISLALDYKSVEYLATGFTVFFTIVLAGSFIIFVIMPFFNLSNSVVQNAQISKTASKNDSVYSPTTSSSQKKPKLTKKNSIDTVISPSTDQVEATAPAGVAARQFIEVWEESRQPVDPDAIYERAEEFSALNKTADAYLLYFYAARLKHAGSAYELAQLADPTTFNHKVSISSVPNPTQANKWYLIAAEAGHEKAKKSLQRLRRHVEKQTALGNAQAWQVELQWR